VWCRISYVRNNPRLFAERLANLQQPWFVIARSARTTIGESESLEVSVRLAGAGEIPRGARLAWRFGEQSGRSPLDGDPIAISLKGAADNRIAVRDLELEAFDGAGRRLSRNVLELCVVPRLQGDAPALYPVDPGAEAILTATGYPHRAASLENADVALATRLTTPVRELLLDGRKILLIANEIDALVDPDRARPASDLHNFPKMELQARAAQGRHLHQAQLPRPWLDHGLDARDALEGRRRKPARRASSARARAELIDASSLSTTSRPTSALRQVPTA